MQSITKKVHQIDTKYENQVIVSAVTTEYPDKVKVVSIFKDEPQREAVEVISIFDKTTSEVTIVETQRVDIVKTVPTTTKQVFTPEELTTAQENYPSIPETLDYVKGEFPETQHETPSTVIVEPHGEIDFVSYIYETETTKTQVVTVYNK